MKTQELRKLIREEVRKMLKEADGMTLSQLQVGDQFKLKQDAVVAPAYGSFFKKIPAAKYANVVFTVLEVTPKSVVCIDGKFKGGSIGSPVNLTRQLEPAFYSNAEKAQAKLKPIKGTIFWPGDGNNFEPEEDVAFNTITFKPLKADSEINKVGQLST